MRVYYLDYRERTRRAVALTVVPQAYGVVFPEEIVRASLAPLISDIGADGSAPLSKVTARVIVPSAVGLSEDRPGQVQETLEGLSTADVVSTLLKTLKNYTHNEADAGDWTRYIFGKLGMVSKNVKERTDDFGSIHLEYTYSGKHRYVHDATAHPLNIYRVSGAAALLAVTGVYDYSFPFVSTLFASEPKASHKLTLALHERPFISENCLRVAVHRAVTEGVAAQDYHAEVIATDHLDATHELLAAYLQTQQIDDDKMSKHAEEIFAKFSAKFAAPNGEQPIKIGTDLERSRYTGILTGLLLASFVRYGNYEKKKNTAKKERLKIVLGLIGAAVSPAPIVGGVIAGVLQAFTESLADAVYEGSNITPLMLKIGAAIEDRSTAWPQKGI